MEIKKIILVCKNFHSRRAFLTYASQFPKDWKILVAPVIDALPSDMSSTIQLAVIAGQVAAIMGIDAGVRKGQKAAQAIKAKKEQNSLEEEPEPIDNPDDLPPGKDTQENIH